SGPWEADSVILTALTVDRAGNLFVADSRHFVWKLDPQGHVTALVGQDATQIGPSSLAVDSRGNLYIGSSNQVWKLAPDGALSVFATGLIYVSRLSIDAADNLYINSVNGLFRASPDGVLSRVVLKGFPNTAFISAIAVDPSGFLAVGLQYQDPSGDIARIGTDGVLRIVPRDAVGCSPSVGPPSDMAVDRSGAVYFADPANVRIRRLDKDGSIHTVAGGPGGALARDGGPATQARLAHPVGLALD